MAENVNSRAAGHVAAERFLKRLYPEISPSHHTATSDPASLDQPGTQIVPMSSRIENLRREASKQLDPDRRASLGQYMTPETTATFMASMFCTWPNNVRLLEPGAGMGSLLHAFIGEFFRRDPAGNLKVTAYEIEPLLADYLCNHLTDLSRIYSGLEHKVHRRDFIHEATFATAFGAAGFTHAIMNPPYKKISSKSEHRKTLQAIDVTTGNLYTAFLALAVELMDPLGEVVAIIPRSFCNGMYFRPFRKWLLERVAIKKIHVFESRRMAFRDDDVLQENIIVQFEKGGTQSSVLLSTSDGATFANYRERTVPFEHVVKASDPERFIHIPTFEYSGADSALFSCTLSELGLEVATGPVVDFRLKEHSLAEPIEGTVPLLYAHHFSGGALHWPKRHKKPNALKINDSTKKWLMPQGWYAVTRRFSAKEEKRRIVSYVVDPRELPFELYGFENHLNVIHSQKRGISPELARGVSLFLNSTIVDQYFRTFSGHTQVNATDLRTMKFPEMSTLIRFGQWVEKQSTLDQHKIDDFIGAR
ncbi:MAG TPA: Eco57I restriction-modification methylase domain-containing protein [Pseudolabrys sp.]|nr:Eco57I restriction-modification methylase domain-containing protein [Pseudolabrys sp.]